MEMAAEKAHFEGEDPEFYFGHGKYEQQTVKWRKSSHDWNDHVLKVLMYSPHRVVKTWHTINDKYTHTASFNPDD